MNAKIVTALIGLLTLAFGVGAFVYPLRVMDFAGFAARIPSEPVAALVETRAVYGGLFVVLGGFTLWTATAPREHGSVLVLIGCLWLGIFAGRVLGASIEGNPGLMSWLGGALELLAGSLLVSAPWMDRESAAPTAYSQPIPPAA